MRTITFITLLFCVTNLYAQTNYYAENKEFNESGYTYVCELTRSGDVVLRNKEYKLTEDDLKFKDTGNKFIQLDHEELELFTYESWLEFRRIFYDIIRHAFSEEGMKLLRGADNDLYVIMFINTETGKIDEVSFNFFYKDSLKYIPISVYRHIELQLKSRCSFVIAEDGKNINYIYLWDCFEF